MPWCKKIQGSEHSALMRGRLCDIAHRRGAFLTVNVRWRTVFGAFRGYRGLRSPHRPENTIASPQPAFDLASDAAVRAYLQGRTMPRSCMTPSLGGRYAGARREVAAAERDLGERHGKPRSNRAGMAPHARPVGAFPALARRGLA